VVAIIPISPYAQRIALSVDDRRAFTADQTQPRLAVIDTGTNTLERWVALPGIAYGTAPTPDGRHLLVTLVQANKVALLDLKTMEVVRTLDVPKAPQEVVLQPDGAFAYVSCDASGQVAVLDLAAFTVARLIDSGPVADGLAWVAAP
jgi:DNA-binding beta-propeller fold protein YncE